jgi:hypothetical protein
LVKIGEAAQFLASGLTPIYQIRMRIIDECGYPGGMPGGLAEYIE